MKFDVVIIGGGLSGLTAGIETAKAGLRTAIITSGQSALHFSSGSFGLLGATEQGEVGNPIEAMASLSPTHPYSKVGVERVAELAGGVRKLFSEAGVTLKGSKAQNHMRLTPIGEFKPAWLSTDSCATYESLSKAGGTIAVVNIKGYLDFFPGFLLNGLNKNNMPAKVVNITTPELEQLRKSTSEMRAPGIAKLLRGKALETFAHALAPLVADCSVVLMPAVIGVTDERPIDDLRRMLGKPVYYVTTPPMSVTGMREQISLRRLFEKLGGTYILGDNVTAGHIEDGELKSLSTANLGEKALMAKQYIIATGTFFSRGLIATPSRIYEPVLNLDVNFTDNRGEWFDRNIFNEQQYMTFGVKTDANFRVSAEGSTLKNVRACGALLGGCNSLKEESGAGVAIITAMEVASRVVTME